MSEIQILNNGDTLYDIRTKINENFELVNNKATTEPLVSFGVNEGNETNGVADLIEITENTLNFKVGGEYPNLVITSGDGVTTRIENVNPLYLQNLADGEYTVLVDGSNSNITDAEFYSQLLEPENVNDGDVWFNGESSYKYNLTSANISHKYTSTHNIYGMARDFNRMVGACDRSTIVQSYDSGQTWTTYGVPTSTPNITFVGCVTRAGVFFLLANNGSIYASTDGAMWSLSAGAPSEYTYTGLKQIGDVFIGFTASRYLLINDGTGGWNLKEVATNVIKDIVLIDNTYYAVDAGGVLFTSTDLTTWKNEGIKYTNAVCMSVYNDKLLVGTSTGQLYIDDLKGNVQTETINSQAQIKVIGVLENKIVVIAGTNGLCVTTVDLKTFNQSSESTGNINFMFENFVGGQTKIFTLETLPVWESYSYIPVGELTISGGEVTYFTTYPYNTNGLFEATSSTFGLLRTAAEPDELNCHCSDAVLTPANLYNLQNFRLGNTEYNVDDKVGCPYHHNLQLKCTVAGTTSSEALNTKGTLEAGTTIEDGTVVWTVEELGTGGGGLEIGDIGIAPLGIDETKGLRRYLNGQVIIQEQYPQFTSKVKSAVALYPSLACTESEWQTNITMSAFGSCGKFVIDDGAGTIRLPKIAGFIQGLTDLASLGDLVEAGLPEIYGSFVQGTSDVWADGAFTAESTRNKSNDGYNSVGTKNYFYASRSNPIYGNSTTVQPEAIRYPYFIQVATGAETEADITNELELNIPFFFGMSKYVKVKPNNTSWLKSAGQWNRKADYPSYYDWILSNANGGVEGFVLSTNTYTDYDFVINTAEETFRLPLLNGEEDIPDAENTTAITNILNTSPYTYTTQRDVSIGIYAEGQVGFGLSTISVNGPANLGFIDSESGVTQCYRINVKRNTTIYSCAKRTAVVNIMPLKGNGSLYFYVGETVQNANLINAGRIEEKLADCITRNDCKAYITETYVNGTSWYRIYSDGWCEQGGRVSSGSGASTVTLLKSYINTNYNCQVTSVPIDGNRNPQFWSRPITIKTVTSFTTNQYDNFFTGYEWCTAGYIS